MRHLHLEFNLDAFYLHRSRRGVNGPQKAPVGLLKTTLWTGWAAYDPEAAHSQQPRSSLRHKHTNAIQFSHISEVCSSFQLWRLAHTWISSHFSFSIFKGLGGKE